GWPLVRFAGVAGRSASPLPSHRKRLGLTGYSVDFRGGASCLARKQARVWIYFQVRKSRTGLTSKEAGKTWPVGVIRKAVSASAANGIRYGSFNGGRIMSGKMAN